MNDQTIASALLGKHVIVRTASAGCWFGILDQKDRDEVVITEARRLWQWKTVQGICLSSIANHGVDHAGSRISEPTHMVWLQAIELIPCSPASVVSLLAAPHAVAS